MITRASTSTSNTNLPMRCVCSFVDFRLHLRNRKSAQGDGAEVFAVCGRIISRRAWYASSSDLQPKFYVRFNFLLALRQYATCADMQQGGHGVCLRPWHLTWLPSSGMKGYCEPARALVCRLKVFSKSGKLRDSVSFS